MGTLSGLPNTAEERDAWTVTSRTQAIHYLRQGKTVTTAGSNGALTVWRDDDGVLRAEYYRFLRVVDFQSGMTMKQVQSWLRDWWPSLGR